MKASLLWAAVVGALASAEAGPVAPLPPNMGPVRLYDVEARMTRGKGKAEATLMEERLSLEVGHASRFAQHTASGPGQMSLKLRAYPQADGRAAIEVEWEEFGSDGAKLEWAPVVSASTGQPATAVVDWNGERRALTLTVR
jgi:hypothetical protein